jgi:hypothetical protein
VVPACVALQFYRDYDRALSHYMGTETGVGMDLTLVSRALGSWLAVSSKEGRADLLSKMSADARAQQTQCAERSCAAGMPSHLQRSTRNNATRRSCLYVSTPAAISHR